MRRKLSRLISLWLVLLVLAGQTVSAAVPKMNAAINRKNIFSLMNAYDTDSAYILKATSGSDDGLLMWWMNSQEIVDSIDVGVHEEFHEYSYMNAPWNTEDIYIGNQKTVRVPITAVFPSKRMASTVPASLRTQRWSVYVGQPDANMASDVQGVYGLLNEFTAYYWGMHAQLSLYDYYKSSKATVKQWQNFVNMCANDRLAYAEFKYFILQYLVYAKQNNRSVYDGIMGNAEFLKAYQTIEKNFAAQIRLFEKRLKQLGELLAKSGYRTEIGEYFYILDSRGKGTGIGIFQNQYDRLISELKKTRYQNILGNGSAAPAVGKTSISSIKSGAAGIALKWKKAEGAGGYYVYRKASGESSYRKVKTTSSLSWTDTSVKKGKQYSYKIVPYAKSSSGAVTKGTASAVKSLRR